MSERERKRMSAKDWIKRHNEMTKKKHKRNTLWVYSHFINWMGSANQNPIELCVKIILSHIKISHYSTSTGNTLEHFQCKLQIYTHTNKQKTLYNGQLNESKVIILYGTIRMYK